MTLTSEIITLNGTDVNVTRGGEGETVWLLHGANGPLSWLPVAEELSDRYHVVVTDHPGYGLSGAPDMIDSISDLAFFYLDLMDRLDLRDIHLSGHSMGGWLAAEIAIRSTERLKSLMLVSSAGLKVKGVPMGDLFLWGPKELAHNVFTRPEFIERHMAMKPTEEQVLAMARHRETSAKLAWSPRFYNRDLHKWLHRITVPSLILWGDSDGIFPEPYAHEFKKFMPDAELTVFERCAHVPMDECHDEFMARMLQFWEGVK